MVSVRGHICVRRMAKDGKDGIGIDGVREYFCWSADGANAPGPDAGWTADTPAAFDPTKPYLWNYEVVTYTNGATTSTRPAMITKAGRGIQSIVNYYSWSASSDTAPTGAGSTPGAAWTTAPGAPTGDQKYLWNYEVVTYTDNSKTFTDPTIIGTKGEAGRGIQSVVNHYLATSKASGVTTATQGWTTSIQSMTATNKYLWNYEVITYTDNTTASTDPHIVGVYGSKGNAGRGIQSITEYYLATSAASGVTRSTQGWTTAIQTVTATDKYLWNYEVITYTDNATESTDPHIIGTYGDKGDKGDTGKTGLDGIIIRRYYWEEGIEAHNDVGLVTSGLRYLDYAFNVPVALIGTTPFKVYKCKQTHVTASSKPLTNTTYWEEVNVFKDLFAPIILTNALSADFIDVASIVAKTAFINALTASQAFLNDLTVKHLNAADGIFTGAIQMPFVSNLNLTLTSKNAKNSGNGYSSVICYAASKSHPYINFDYPNLQGNVRDSYYKARYLWLPQTEDYNGVTISVFIPPCVYDRQNRQGVTVQSNAPLLIFVSSNNDHIGIISANSDDSQDGSLGDDYNMLEVLSGFVQLVGVWNGTITRWVLISGTPIGKNNIW